MRAAFVKALIEQADRNPRVLLLTGDLGFMALEPFAERFPERFFNVGVAEQNMVAQNALIGVAVAQLLGWTPIERIFSGAIVGPALRQSFAKLDPRHVAKNPVMFVVEIGSVLTTIWWIRDLLVPAGERSAPLWFTGNVTVWLWFTVVFANFAEAMAEGRGKAQAESMRRARTCGRAAG
jgi:hypothetical protein